MRAASRGRGHTAYPGRAGVVVGVRVHPETRARLEDYSATQRITISEAVRRVLDVWARENGLVGEEAAGGA
jgi:hypothetical protein